MLERRPPVSVLSMDNILRQLEGLSRHELVWLNTYLAGRLRALPPSSVQQVSAQPEVTATTSSTASGGTNNPGPTAATLAPLPEPIEALNYSLDPWERTGAAPQRLGESPPTVAASYTGLYSTTTPGTCFLSLTSELPVLLRLLDQEIRAMLRRLLLVALGRHLSLSASLLGRHSARIPAATAGLSLVMLVLSMMTTPAMIVNNNFCILRECLVPHGGFRSCRAVSFGVTDAPPKDPTADPTPVGGGDPWATVDES